MTELIPKLLFWHWWILAALLFALEVMLPGTFCMWIGFAAVATGLAVFVLPDLSWQMQLLSFALLSVAVIALWLRYKPMARGADTGTLNHRGASQVGQVYVLVTAIENGVGRARVGDSEWRVQGPDLPVGSRVRVLSVNGNTLVVEAA